MALALIAISMKKAIANFLVMVLSSLVLKLLLKNQSGRSLLRAEAALEVFLACHFELLVRHQHGIHHMDDAIRLIDVSYCHRRSTTFFVAHDDVVTVHHRG